MSRRQRELRAMSLRFLHRVRNEEDRVWSLGLVENKEIVEKQMKLTPEH